jgi:hypothetical protein
MWAFFSRRFRLWLLLALGLPLLRRVLGRAGDAVEARRPQSPIGRGLRSGNQYLARFERKSRRKSRR